MKRAKLVRMLMCILLTGALMLTPFAALAAEPGDPPARQETAGVRAAEAAEEPVPLDTGEGQETEPPEEQLEWAVILYICASDLETNGGNATSALVDILNMDLPDGLEVVAITGGAKTWDPLGTGENQEGYIKPKPDENAVYRIQKKESPSETNRMVKLGEIQTADGKSKNMGDPETAIELFKLVDSKFPAAFAAKHVMLVFVDHGGAWAGAELDENYSDVLDTPELRKTVEAAKELHGGQNLDILGFDACMMSCLEVAWHFKDLADYLVATEEVEFTPGWRYHFLDTNGTYNAWNDGSAAGVGPVELGESVIDTYIHAVEESQTNFVVRTLALTDLSKMDALRDAFAEFSSAVLAQITDELLRGETPEDRLATFVQVARTAETTQAMHAGRGMIDMYDFLNRLNQTDTLKGKADAVIAALGVPPAVENGNYVGATTGTGQAVLYRGTCAQLNRSGGMAVYYPLVSGIYPLTSLEPLYKMDGDGPSLDLMDSYGALLKVLSADTDREVITFNGELETAVSDSGLFTVRLTRDANTIKKTEFITTYTDFEAGATYLLGTDLVTEDWVNDTLSKEPYETWSSVNGNPVTMRVTIHPDLNLAGTGVNLYTMPVTVELLNGNVLDAELSVLRRLDDNVQQIYSLKYFVSYEDALGETHTVSASIPLAAVETAYPVLDEYDVTAHETTGDRIIFDDPVLYRDAAGSLRFSLGLTKLESGSAGYYSSYIVVTDLAGNTFRSDPYTYILADSYEDFYLGVVFPVLRDPETGAVGALRDTDIRIMYNGIDVTESVCPDLDPAKAVTYNDDVTMGTVRVDLDLGDGFEAGTLETSFAVCADEESFMTAVAELLNGQYDPWEYGEHKHPFGECEDPCEMMEHIRVVENAMFYYALGLDMADEADLAALNDAYALLTEEFGASLTSGDMELLSQLTAYGYADGLTFTAEKTAPAGNAAYQNITSGMGKVVSYHVGLTKPSAAGGTVPAGKLVPKEADALKLSLSGLSKSDIANLKLYYMEDGSATPRLIPWESSDNYAEDHITLVENRGGPYLIIFTSQTLNDSYFVLCVPSDGESFDSAGGTDNAGGTGGAGSTAAPGIAAKTTTVNSTTTGTTASAAVSSSALNGTVSSAVKEAAQKGAAPVVEIKVNTSSNADSLELTLPVGPLEALAGADNSSLVITSGIAEVMFDHTALSALVSEAAGSTIVLEVAPVDGTALSAVQKGAVSTARVVDLSLRSNGVAIHNYNGGKITVTLPYTLKSGESAGDIVVYYLDDDGSLTPCSTSYSNGKVTFVTSYLL